LSQERHAFFFEPATQLGGDFLHEAVTGEEDKGAAFVRWTYSWIFGTRASSNLVAAMVGSGMLRNRCSSTLPAIIERAAQLLCGTLAKTDALLEVIESLAASGAQSRTGHDDGRHLVIKLFAQDGADINGRAGQAERCDRPELVFSIQ